MSGDPIGELCAEHFEALVGRSLEADFGEGPVATRVLAVERSPSPSPRSGGAYSVWLSAPVASPSQGNFTLMLPIQGPLALFCCPRRRDGKNIVYELIFN